MDQLCILKGSLTTVSTRAPSGCRGGESSPNILGRTQPELGGGEDLLRDISRQTGEQFLLHSTLQQQGRVQGLLQAVVYSLLPPQLMLTLLVFLLPTNPQLPVFKKNNLRFFS